MNVTAEKVVLINYTVVDSDGKTPLPFHIERYDATGGIATLWVANTSWRAKPS